MELAAEKQRRADELLEATHKRQVELIAQGLAADASWEMEFARQAATSWKDEYTLIAISAPALLCFIPGYAKHVAAGFAALGQTPIWYQTIFCIMFCATVGVRFWRRNQSDT
jgi:hypothetical protein